MISISNSRRISESKDTSILLIPRVVPVSTFARSPDGAVQPMPGPRFTVTPAGAPRPAPAAGAHTREVLADAGVSPAIADELYDLGVIGG